MPSTVLIVDAANVVGSVPDGWWRDRAGAATRLRDALVPLATEPPEFADGEPVEITLVVEGAARSVRGVPGVDVVAAKGSGDDAIVDLVRAHESPENVIVVTADRGLRRRVTELGARIVGPRTVYPPRG